jgi:hypothetical protein
MNPINRILVQTIREHRDEMIANICNRLQKLAGSHYEVIDFDRLQEREETALSALVKSIETKDLLPLTRYIEETGTIRSSEGYPLSEVQNALRIFEEELWQMLIKYQPAEKPLIDMLALCNWIVGQAKDHLAQIYLKISLDKQAQLDALRDKFHNYILEKKENGWLKKD